MAPWLIAATVFACTFGGALAGMRTRGRLPEHHLSKESKDVVQLCMGLIATLTALVLGLVTASAKQSFDEQGAAVRSIAASLLTLDRTLGRYGPEAQPIRDDLARSVKTRVDAVWRLGLTPAAPIPGDDTKSPDDLEDDILALSPHDARQTWLRSQALSVASDSLKTRWLALIGAHTSIPAPFLVVIVFWLSALFWSFGLFAPENRTVASVLLLAALSVAASVFLILEMQTPLHGLLKISSEPLDYVLANLGK